MKIREQLSWQKEAACASPDVYSEVFFLNDPESDAEALAICSSCPVRTQCLDANFGVPDGVFGGTTAAERRAMGGGRDVFRLNLNFSNRGRVVDEGVPDPLEHEWHATLTREMKAENTTPEERMAEAVKLYNSGSSIKAASLEAGVGRDKLSLHLRNQGIVIRDEGTYRTQRMMEKVRIAAEIYCNSEGAKIKDLCKVYKISNKSLAEYLKSQGVDLSVRHRLKVDDTVRAIVELLKEGSMGTAEIARTTGVKKQKVHDVRRNLTKGLYS